MSQNLYYTVIILTLIGLIGCSKEHLITNTDYDSPIEFSVTASEGNNSPVTIKMKTIETLPCSNYTILTEYDVSKTKHISIIPLRNELESDVCLTSIGPAKTEIKFELEKGIYTLGFRNAHRLETFGINFFIDTLEVDRISSDDNPYFILNR